MVDLAVFKQTGGGASSKARFNEFILSCFGWPEVLLPGGYGVLVWHSLLGVRRGVTSVSVWAATLLLGPDCGLLCGRSVLVALSLTSPRLKYLGLAPCINTPRSSNSMMSFVYLLHAGNVDFHKMSKLCASVA